MDLKQAIADITWRSQPDLSKEFILTTDASNEAIGALLSQKINQNEIIISTYSKKPDKTQFNYSTTDKELLAVVKGIENFRHYLIGRHFTLRTDHRALQYLWNTKNENSRIMRWALKLQEYSFIPEFIRGEENYADGLSRSVEVNQLDKSKKRKEIFYARQKNKIIAEYHICSGHGGINNMNFLIRQKYYWPKLSEDIKSFLKSSRKCLLFSNPNQNTKNRIINSKYSNEIWECDLIGRLDLLEQKSI